MSNSFQQRPRKKNYFKDDVPLHWKILPPVAQVEMPIMSLNIQSFNIASMWYHKRLGPDAANSTERRW